MCLLNNLDAWPHDGNGTCSVQTSLSRRAGSRSARVLIVNIGELHIFLRAFHRGGRSWFQIDRYFFNLPTELERAAFKIICTISRGAASDFNPQRL